MQIIFPLSAAYLARALPNARCYVMAAYVSRQAYVGKELLTADAAEYHRHSDTVHDTEAGRVA